MESSGKLKSDKVAKLVSRHESHFHPGETVEFVGVCNNFSPSAGHLIVTNLRLLAVPKYGNQVAWETPLIDIVEVTGNSGKQQLTIATRSGGTPIFKLVPAEDQPGLVEHIQTGRNMDPATLELISALRIPMEERMPSTRSVARVSEPADVVGASDAADKGKIEAKAEKTAAKAEKAKVRKQEQLAKAKAKRDRLAGNLRKYGPVVKEAPFGAKTVAIHGNGYVRIATFMTASTPFEKLHGISYSRTVRDKSSGGRAVASFASGGVSRLASNERLDTFLTITTDARVHSLTAQGRMSDGTGTSLEAAGKAILDAVRSVADVQSVATQESPVRQPSVSVAPDLADQIQKLAALRSQGILTEAEFTASKARLLE